jgi:hypothetical protein
MNRGWSHVRNHAIRRPLIYLAEGRAAEDVLNRLVIHQAAEYDRHVFRSVNCALACHGSGFYQWRHLFRSPVPHADGMPGFQKAIGHPGTHVAEAKKRDFHLYLL